VMQRFTGIQCLHPVSATYPTENKFMI
jgi:hypothetical protein